AEVTRAGGADVDRLTRDGDRTGGRVPGGGDGGRGEVEIGVGKDDDRSRGAQFQGQLLHSGDRGQVLPDAGRSGERDLPHPLIGASRSPSSPPEPVSTDSTPSGSPASMKHSARANAVSGVVLAGLRITELPAASAGAILWLTNSAG